MARGVRKTTIEKLNDLRNEKLELKGKLVKELAECNKEISQLEQDIELEEVKEISLLIKKSGKSLEDVKNLLSE